MKLWTAAGPSVPLVLETPIKEREGQVHILSWIFPKSGCFCVDFYQKCGS